MLQNEKAQRAIFILTQISRKESSRKRTFHSLSCKKTSDLPRPLFSQEASQFADLPQITANMSTVLSRTTLQKTRKVIDLNRKFPVIIIIVAAAAAAAAAAVQDVVGISPQKKAFFDNFKRPLK